MGQSMLSCDRDVNNFPHDPCPYPLIGVCLGLSQLKHLKPNECSRHLPVVIQIAIETSLQLKMRLGVPGLVWFPLHQTSSIRHY